MAFELPYKGGKTETYQTKFKGLNRTEGASDGEIRDMVNLSSDAFPALCVRGERKVMAQVAAPSAIGAYEGLFYVDGTTLKYCRQPWNADGTCGISQAVTCGTLSSEKPKVFAAIGAYVVIFPDKVIYDVDAGTLVPMEKEVKTTTITFSDGTIYGEEAEANTLYVPNADWESRFSVGDAVTISGLTVLTDNNKTPIIREISGDYLRFYENVFTNGTETHLIANISVKRCVPDLDFILVNDNRVWGCKGDEIRCSKLGDPFNWNVFDGLETDSYAVDTGTAGEFTGCVSYLGYPMFFKADRIFKVYGNLPSKYQVMPSATMGVAKGAGMSLAIAGETLFYLSESGICAYTGGLPSLISEPLGAYRWKNAVAGSDGVKYFVWMEANAASAKGLYVYDTRYGVWCREDCGENTGGIRVTAPAGFAYYGGVLHCLDGRTTGYNLFTVSGSEGLTGVLSGQDDVIASEFVMRFYEASPNKKRLSRIMMRLRQVSASCVLSATVRTGGTEAREQTAAVCVSDYDPTDIQSVTLPFLPVRTDTYELDIRGQRRYTVYAIDRMYHIGSKKRN